MKNKTKNLIIIALLCLSMFGFQDVVFAAETCPLGPDVTKDLYNVLKIFRIVAPILVIALSSLEAIKALTKGDGEADLKKVAQRFGKRAVFAVILFFLPTLVDQVFQMLDVWGVNGSCNFEAVETGNAGSPDLDKQPNSCNGENEEWSDELGKCIPKKGKTTEANKGQK